MVSDDRFETLRRRMVDEHLAARGIYDQRVLAVMRHVPRHEFVPAEFAARAYEDGPLPIGENQTISQPFVVALMTQELRLIGHERVLEIGTGSGYQTAILCQLAAYVYSIERNPHLARRAAQSLHGLLIENVDIHAGDGSQGLADMSPYDAVIVTAAAPVIPGPLCSQLSQNGGRMVIPVGNRERQVLQRVTRKGNRCHVEQIVAVKFVPLVGRYGFKTMPGGDPGNED